MGTPFTDEAYAMLLARFNNSAGHDENRVETLIRLTNIAIIAAAKDDPALIERYVGAYFVGGSTNFARLVAAKCPCCLDHKLLAVTDLMPALTDLIVATTQEALINVNRMAEARGMTVNSNKH